MVEVIADHPPTSVEDRSSSLVHTFGKRAEGGRLGVGWFRGDGRWGELPLLGAEVQGRGAVRLHVMAGRDGAPHSLQFGEE